MTIELQRPEVATSPAAVRLALLEQLAEGRRELDELRAKRLRVKARKWRNDPVLWIEQRIAVEDVATYGHLGWRGAWSKQQQILYALRDGRNGVPERRRTAVMSCHGVGKSYIAADAAAWWLDVHAPGTAFVVTSAPTYAQVRAILWRYIRQLHKKGGLVGRVNQTEWSIDGEIVAFGRKPADHDEAAFQGIHAPHVLVILDEAGGIPAQLWIAGDALTTNEGSCMLAIGNPDNPASYFKEICDPMSQVGALWHHIGISAFESPNLTGEYVPPHVSKMLVSRQWIDEKLAEWGEDSPIYQSKVLGRFPTQNEWAVVRVEDVMDCRHAEPRTMAEEKPVHLGVDVGGGGDLTVIRERRGMAAGRQWQSNSDRPEELAPFIVQAIIETGATMVKIDCIGIGWGVVGELRNRQKRGEFPADVIIVGVNVAEKAENPEKYINKRAEIWWEVGRQLSADHAWDLGQREGGRMTGAYLVDDLTLAELTEVRWHNRNASGRIQIESKDEVRDRNGGRSPDHADALLLAFYSPGAARDPKGWLSGYADAQRQLGAR